MRKPDMKNRGYTLIELIIVVAMLAVIGMVLAFSINTGTTAKAKGCAEEINALLSRCRIEAMSRAGEVRLSITTEGEGVIRGVITVDEGGTTVLENRVLAKDMLIVDPMPLNIGFDRATGAMRFYSTGGEPAPSLTRITVSGGDSDFTVLLVPSTGLHYLEDNSDE